MNPDNDRNYVRVKKTALLIVILIVVAGLLGWFLGRSNDPKPTNNQTNNTQPDNTAQPVPASTSGASDVKALASYTLPDGWKEASCPSAPGAVYVLPNGSGGVDCGANPSSPVKISVDPANSKDCNQLQNVQNVSKHICISEYINGKKSLKSETVYGKDSSYKKDTAINAYYVDTGKGIVKVEYIHDPSSTENQASFEQLAHSVQAK